MNATLCWISGRIWIGFESLAKPFIEGTDFRGNTVIFMIMSSINDLEDLHELKQMYAVFSQYALLDIKYLASIADDMTNREYEQSKNSSTTTNQTTRRPGDHIVLERIPVTSRCTIPLAMLLFSVIDFVGRIAEPMLANGRYKFSVTRGFARNAQIFFFYLCEIDILISDERANIFMDKFRHNIMHSYLPGSGDKKAQYSIAYIHENLSNSLFEKNGVEEVLNVNFLRKLVEKGIEKFKKVIDEDIYTEQIVGVYNEQVLKHIGN